jgi:hypothetical protein
MNTQIDSAVRAGRGYWFVDGFTEMLGGGLFTLLGGILVLRNLLSGGALLAGFASLAADIVLIKFIGLIVIALSLWWLKDRFTYPRSGFVRGKRITTAQALTFLRNALLILLLPLLVLAAAISLLNSFDAFLAWLPIWLPVFIGALWGVLAILAGRWLGLKRFILLGGLILLTGLLTGAWQLALGFPAALDASLERIILGISMLTLVCGLLFTASGLVTFLRYRRANPRPYEEAL